MTKTRRRASGTSKQAAPQMATVLRRRTIWGGIDMGGLSMRLVFRVEGRNTDVSNPVTIPTPRDPGAWIQAMQEPGARALAKLGATWADVAYIGFGIPGPFDIDKGVVVEVPNLGPRWRGYALADEVKKVLDVPALLENDAKAAGLGEMMEGCGKDHETIAGFTLGTGIGGFYIDNRGPSPTILRGTHGIGGEFGHIPIYPMSPMHIFDRQDLHPLPRPCNCKRTGCLESFVGAVGIEAWVADLRSRDEPSSLFDTGLWDQTRRKDHVRLIHQHAEAGDALSIRIFKMQAWSIAVGIRTIAVTLDPSAFVLCGGMTKSGDRFLEMIRHYYYADLSPFPRASVAERMPIIYGQLLDDAGMVGATYVARSRGITA